MARTTIRVGFDFDGVIAYNPLRTLRLPAMLVKRIIHGGKSDSLHFPYPTHPAIRWLWERAHKTSFFPSTGFSMLCKMLSSGAIEGHIITGRYAFLRDELEDWLKKNKIDSLFTGVHVNMKDEQPHMFKEQMLKKLNLDYFVEDNWDIVQYLNSKGKISNSKTEIHWIYNLLDRFQQYPHKHPYLKSFLKEIGNRE